MGLRTVSHRDSFSRIVTVKNVNNINKLGTNTTWERRRVYFYQSTNLPFPLPFTCYLALLSQFQIFQFHYRSIVLLFSLADLTTWVPHPVLFILIKLFQEVNLDLHYHWLYSVTFRSNLNPPLICSLIHLLILRFWPSCSKPY